MFGFIGKLFGSDKSVESIVSGVSNGLDALVYTDEEKATDAAKERAAARGMLIDWMQSTSGQNLARRFIALSLTMMWGVIHGIKTILATAAPWLTDKTEQIMLSVKALEEATTQLNGAMMLILAFYFAAPHMGSIVEGALNKFGSKK
jgi:hypothetical protein